MSSPTATEGLRVRPVVLEARQRLAEVREKSRRQHESGSPGIQLCGLLSDHFDAIVRMILEAAIADQPGDHAALEQNLALVAHGGYGRREMAPYSDIDLMLLHQGLPQDQVARLAQRITMDVFDAGLTLGLSVRTPAEASQLSWQDAKILTSLAESRLLLGSEALFQQYYSGLKHLGTSWSESLIDAVEKSRQEERTQYGETVFLLEPNVKRSPGCLRDVQLLRWIGFLRYGESQPDTLCRQGALLKADQQLLLKATEFLLRLRNEMHFHSGKSSDVLDRAEQVRIAEKFNYSATPTVLPVEAFMRDYFEYTGAVKNIVTHFASASRPRSWLDWFEPLLGHQVEGDFHVGPTYISATSRGLAKVTQDVAQVLRLMDLSNLYDRKIDDATWNAVRDAMMHRDEIEVGPEAYERFLSILTQPPRLGDILRQLHELRVLDKLVPGMAHARCLLQWNQYHKYTVDEHCLRAVECGTDFFTDQGPVGEAYRGLKRKRTLHLALLIHDLGKGYVEDHSDVGLRLADEAAQRFKLPPREAEKLKFLVHKHLLMSDLAFQKDTTDENAVVQFAVECGTPDVVRMLFVMTCADFAAVGPGVFNHWKLQVLTDLFHRTMYHLAPDAGSPASRERLSERREELWRLVGTDVDAWYHKQIAVLPRDYLLATAPRQMATELRQFHELGRQDALAWGRWLEDRQAVEYSVGTYEQAAPGVFHRVAGALSSQGLQILSAEIHTLAEGLVWDRFYVEDLDFAGCPPADRLESVSQKLVAAIKDPVDGPPKFRKMWQVKPSLFPSLPLLEPRVRVDNSSSDRYTEFAVFAHDKLGLLYTIAQTLFDLGLSVWVAKIGTHLDQVLDVFYVTDRVSGAKITDESRIEQIRTRLLERIKAFELQSP